MLTKLRFLGIIWRHCCAVCTVTEVSVPWSFLSILIVTKTKVLMLILSIHLACPYNHYLPARFISISKHLSRHAQQSEERIAETWEHWVLFPSPAGEMCLSLQARWKKKSSRIASSKQRWSNPYYPLCVFHTEHMPVSFYHWKWILSTEMIIPDY